MHRDLNALLPKFDVKRTALSAFAISMLLAGQAFAAKPGHGSVTSAPGASLQITLPMLDLNAQDQLVLSAKIADTALWAQAGLTPPVALESLSVSVLPGLTQDTRRIVVSSKQVATKSPVDILLEVTTATGASQVQSSYLVLIPDTSSRDAGIQPLGQFKVSRGDTLFAIAQRNALPGTDIYQMLMAIYQANPEAFIADNMNLLRAGASIRIPDMDTVRAIDPGMARTTYQKHLSAFNQRRAMNTGRTATSALVPGATQSGEVTPASPAPVTGEKVDQVLLSAATAAEKNADARVAATKEIAELQSRIDALQQNVQQLKEIVGEPEATSDAATPPEAASSPASETGVSVSEPTAAQSAQTTSAPVAALTPPAVKTDSTDAAAIGNAASASLVDRLTSFLAQNILAVLTAILALSALVIAWMLRRAGERRDEESDEMDASMVISPAVQSAFSQKLQSIDLSLGDDPLPPKATPTISKTP